MFIYHNSLPKALASNENQAIWFLLGDELVLIDESLESIVSKTNSGYKNEFHCSDKYFNFQFLEESTVSGLFDEKKCFIFRLQTLVFSEKQLKSIQYFLEKNQTHKIIFIYDEFISSDKNKSLVKLFDKFGTVVRHMKIKPEAFNFWVKTKLAKKGISLSEKGFDLLCYSHFGNAIQVLQTLKKIELLNEKAISDEKLYTLLDENNSCTIFDFINGIYEKNPAKSLKNLHTLFKNGEPIIKILYLLDKEVRLLLNLLNPNPNSSVGLKQDFIFAQKKPIMLRYLKNTSVNNLLKATSLIGLIDRSTKGLNNSNSISKLNNLIYLLTK